MTDFRRRYDELEARRRQLMERLSGLEGRAGAHPSYKRAQTLLNQTFRYARVAQRLAILQAAEWMIDPIETWGPML